MLITAVMMLCTLKGAEPLELSWGGPAEIVYDLGTIHNVRRHPDGGISLFDMELIENDSPGSGMSEKGTFSDFVWGAHRARKTLPSSQRSKFPSRFGSSACQKVIGRVVSRSILSVEGRCNFINCVPIPTLSGPTQRIAARRPSSATNISWIGSAGSSTSFVFNWRAITVRPPADTIRAPFLDATAIFPRD